MKDRLWKEVDHLNDHMSQLSKKAEISKQNGDIETLKEAIREQQMINKRYSEILPLLEVLEEQSHDL